MTTRLFTGAAPIHQHTHSSVIHVIAGLPSLTMHATSMSCLMDNFLAHECISLKHLTFIDTVHFNILSNEGLHLFNTWLLSWNACLKNSFWNMWVELAFCQINEIKWPYMMNRTNSILFITFIKRWRWIKDYHLHPQSVQVNDFNPDKLFRQMSFFYSENLAENI